MCLNLHMKCVNQWVVGNWLLSRWFTHEAAGGSRTPLHLLALLRAVCLLCWADLSDC